ncbi:MAG: CHAD domain-containing protein [Saprospiraceae bacterium]
MQELADSVQLKLDQATLLTIALAQAPESELVHQLRVYLKKLRALISLLGEMGLLDKEGKIEKPFRKTFKRLSVLRDLFVVQAQLKSVSKKELPASIHAILDDDFVDTIADLQRYLDKNREEKAWKKVGKKIKQSVTHCNEALCSGVLRAYHDSLIEWLKNAIPEQKDLHPIRKEIKRLLHQISFFKEFYTLEIEQESIDTLTEIQELLGQWRDQTITIQWLKGLMAFDDADMMKEAKAIAKTIRKSEQNIYIKLSALTDKL